MTINQIINILVAAVMILVYSGKFWQIRLLYLNKSKNTMSIYASFSLLLFRIVFVAKNYLENSNILFIADLLASAFLEIIVLYFLITQKYSRSQKLNSKPNKFKIYKPIRKIEVPFEKDYYLPF